MTGIVTGEPKSYQVNAKKNGTDYDSCPNADCGRRDIDPSDRIGTSPDGNLGSPDANLYFDDPRQGGCGASWSRTRGALADQRAQKGLPTKGLTGDAMRAAYVSVPSDAYRDAYERVFGHS